jgi:hypothetical protein
VVGPDPSTPLAEEGWWVGDLVAATGKLESLVVGVESGMRKLLREKK